jgi:hypothetical protein
MNDFFSGSKPDLISMKSMNDLVNIVVEGGISNLGAGTAEIVTIGGGSENNNNNLNSLLQNINKPTMFNPKEIYQNYIKPNLLPIIIILLFVLFVLYRYFSIKEEKFNPGEPVDAQINRNSYVDVNIPVLYDIEKITQISDDEMINKIKKKSTPFEKSPRVSVNKRPEEDREEVIYGTNVWENPDDGIPNPLYDVDFVSSTASAVHFNNEQNRSSLDTAAKMIFH